MGARYLPPRALNRTAFLLAAGGFTPLFGRIFELFGRKLVYLIGFSLFRVSSLLCSLSFDVTSLLAFRPRQAGEAHSVGALIGLVVARLLREKD